MTERKIDFKRIAVYKQDKKKHTHKSTRHLHLYIPYWPRLCVINDKKSTRYERIILLSTHVYIYKNELSFSQHTVKRLLENYRLILFIYFNAFQYLYIYSKRPAEKIDFICERCCACTEKSCKPFCVYWIAVCILWSIIFVADVHSHSALNVLKPNEYARSVVNTLIRIITVDIYRS